MRQQGCFVQRGFCAFCCAASLLLQGGAATLQPLVDVDAPAAEIFSSAEAEAQDLDPPTLPSNESLALGLDATELALTLTSAALQVLADGPRQSVAAELARRLLELDDGGHLAEAFARPAVSAALAWKLRGIRCMSSELVSAARKVEGTGRRRQNGDNVDGHKPVEPANRPAADVVSDHLLPPDPSVQQAPTRDPPVQRARLPSFKLMAHRAAVASANRTHRPAATPESPLAQLLQTTTAHAAQDGVQDGAALLQGFVRDPKGGAGWAALRGWVSGSDPCGSSGGGHAWEGIYCDDTDGRVTEVILQNYPDLRFELLGRKLARLDRLSAFAMADTAMSGTIPSKLGDLTNLQELYLYSNPSLSGTIPSELGDLTNLEKLELTTNPSLSGTIPSELGELMHLQQLYVFENPSLSGTIPSELGDLTNLQQLNLHSNPSLSGTIPSELGELLDLRQLYLHSNPSLSGTTPSELGELTKLQLLYLCSNPSLSGTIPSELGELLDLGLLDLHSNPSLSGTIPSELAELTYLEKLFLYNNPSLTGTIPSELGELTNLRELYLHSNPWLSGSVPTLQGSTRLKVLDLHNCSLTGLPASLPESVTHLYLNRNPIDAYPANLSSLLKSVPTLHVLDAGFINSKVQLQHTGGGNGYGTIVRNPSPCHIGAPCAFVLTMYDNYNQPVNQGALLHNLTLVLGDRSTPMLDNRDGTFTALIPDGWVREVGSYTFEFVHDGQEFRPMLVGPATIAAAADCINNPSTDQLGGACKGLRTVELLPRECIDGSHTRLDDDSVTTCVCDPGYERNGNSSSCHRDCRHLGERLSRDGGSCECSGRNYNSSTNGILLCSTSGWEAALASAEFHEAVAIRNEGGACVPCPLECVRCEDGIPTLREGWRLNTTTDAALRSLLLNATDGRSQFAFSCPYGSTDCPEIKLDTLPTNQSDGLSCLGHHTGALCASCMDGFSRRGSSDNACSRCADVSNYIQTQYGLRPGWFAAVLCAAALLVSGSLYMLWPKVILLKAETKTNLRIMLGSAQVLSLMPTVLEMVFPPQPRAALSFTSLLVADLKTVMRTECWGWSWFESWLVSVVGVPLLATVLVAGYYLSRLVEARRLDAESRREAYAAATQESLRALAFLAMFLYPRLSAEIFSALHCRALGPSSSWLEADYDVSCEDPRYVRYENAAFILTAVVPIGFPLALLAALVHQWRLSRELWADTENDPGGGGSNAVGTDDTEEQQFAQYHYARVQSLFGFAVEDFRPDCWWFEPADLLRKLALSGLLQFVHRGTAAQCFCGSAIAFASFGVQQHLRPYREPESNTLKALVDTQLFLAFLVSFILRVLDVPGFPGSEPFGTEMYGLLLLCSMVLLVIAAVALTAMQIARRQKFRARLLDVDLAGLSTHMYGAEAPAALPDGIDSDSGQSTVSSAAGGSSVSTAGSGYTPAQAAAVVTVVGQSRPASPDRTTAIQPEPELELAAGAE